MSIVSVIVPVYNVENYLCECIDSVITQTLHNIELILVDDGSTDASGAICDKYAATDSRIKVIHKKNEGVSTARNTALDIATGDYIIFLDADDYWNDNNILLSLYSKAQVLNLDIIRGEYMSIDEHGNEILKKNYSKKTKYEELQLDSITFLDNIINGEFFLFLCLIKRALIQNIRFDKNMIFLEDLKFYISLLSSYPTCGYINHKFYGYRKHGASVSNISNIKKLIDSFSLCDFFYQTSQDSHDNNGFKQYCQQQAVMMYYWTLQTVASDLYYNIRQEIIANADLVQLQKRTKQRLKHTNIKPYYYPFIILPARFGIPLLRMKDFITNRLSKLRK